MTHTGEVRNALKLDTEMTRLSRFLWLSRVWLMIYVVQASRLACSSCSLGNCLRTAFQHVTSAEAALSRLHAGLASVVKSHIHCVLNFAGPTWQECQPLAGCQKTVPGSIDGQCITAQIHHTVRCCIWIHLSIRCCARTELIACAF
jgi:hypothetical protein